MISVNQALEIVQNNINPTQHSELKDTKNALGNVLYRDIVSPINMPPFNQSAMDGYALHLHESSNYQIIGEIKAGDDSHPTLQKGEGVRIFTGAAVPESANAVVMQERVSITNQNLILDTKVSLQENIRPIGEQVNKDQIALKKGTVLTPAAVAFLSTLGITKVSVYKKPSIAIIVTGNELVEAGQSLTYGLIYESNSIMLTSALNSLGYPNVKTHKVDDNYEHTVDLLWEAMSAYDMVIISGGISVGDYDFVGKALQELEVKELFYKVKQKPGKPLFFGKTKSCVVFALPGNPAAALSCYYIYVQTALQIMSGNSSYTLSKTIAQSQSNYVKKGNRSQFLKAIYKHGNVEILEGQSSAMLQTFAIANAFVVMPESLQTININDDVEVILLPLN
ncbi:molybdopterin molybdenumtransferase MoeA [Flavobacteriales bacterium 34_180_T64]|nr:molybdopterin molybdenumtransferase MoeA [Flavobacteriales bacterium 34_180_T64]